MSFSIDHHALWIILGLLLIGSFIRLRFTHSSPYLLFSNVANLVVQPQSLLFQWRYLPSQLFGLAILFFTLAFLDPHILIPKNASDTVQTTPTEGIAIYLVLDQSGSMSEKLVGEDAMGHSHSIRKIDLLKQVTEQFIKKESSNLIGIVGFARFPHVLSPLTLDQDTLLEQLATLNVVQKPEEDGTSMGYSIYKTSHFIAASKQFAQNLKDQASPAYTIKNSVIVLVTDGLQHPSPLDKGNRLRTIELDEAAEFAKDNQIRLYVINIDPLIASKEYEPHRKQLKAITQKTGGDFFLVNDNQSLQQIYDQIDSLEKQAIYSKTTSKDAKGLHFKRLSFYPYLILLGLSCLFISLLLETTLFRKAP